ncbi:hypothetical protein V1514DRAFT_332679 [Lipomyces japonicus]|uniref:uncharacterized protein n=1 Tax=Lipomyces japonicus TaxID=56871 RepID=UPI0034CD4829
MGFGWPLMIARRTNLKLKQTIALQSQRHMSRLVLPPPKLITIDAFGTIYTPRPTVAEQYSNLYAVHFPLHDQIDPETLDASFKVVFKSLQQTHPNYAGGERNWWCRAIRDTFRTAKAAAFIDNDVAEDTEIFVLALYNHFNTGAAYALWPDISSFLAAIPAQTRLGVLSNSDTRSREVLRGLGIIAEETSDQDGAKNKSWIKTESHVLLSSEVGVEKPDPAIFETAVRVLVGEDDWPQSQPQSQDLQLQLQQQPEITKIDALNTAREILYWHIGDEAKRDIQPVITHGHGRLRGWGAVHIKRANECGDSTPGGHVVLKHSGTIIEVSDLRDIQGLWMTGVEVDVEE